MILLFAALFIFGAVLISNELHLDLNITAILAIAMVGIGAVGLAAAAWHGTRKALQ